MAAKSSKSKKETPKTSEGVKHYLILYNSIQLTAWSYILSRIIAHFYAGNSATTLYQENKILIQVFQNAAVMEIIHVALGFVKSNLMTTIIQVFSRVALCLGILIQSDVAQSCIGITPMLTAWSLSEIVRYSFYVLNLVGYVPYVLIWCRYTFFYFLYPIGVTGELLCMYFSLQTFNEEKAHYISSEYCSTMKYTIIGLMISYIPVFPKMYFHMISQRKKVIGGKPVKKTQ